MENGAILLAKIAGLKKKLSSAYDKVNFMYWADSVNPFLVNYQTARYKLVRLFPDLYDDLPERAIPQATTGQNGLFFEDDQINPFISDIDYILEVWSNTQSSQSLLRERPDKIFITHGRSQDWRVVQSMIEKDLNIDTIELAQQPNLGNTLIEKLELAAEKCSYAVIVMTGDDYSDSEMPRVRENVMHEIGFFQGKYGRRNVCLLHEQGVNTPTNMAGIAYYPYAKGAVESTFLGLSREISTVFK